jgi:hypothetical protein
MADIFRAVSDLSLIIDSFFIMRKVQTQGSHPLTKRECSKWGIVNTAPYFWWQHFTVLLLQRFLMLNHKTTSFEPSNSDNFMFMLEVVFLPPIFEIQSTLDYPGAD